MKNKEKDRKSLERRKMMKLSRQKLFANLNDGFGGKKGDIKRSRF